MTYVNFYEKNEIGYVEINHPPLNVITVDVLKELQGIIDKLDSPDCHIRVVVIKSAIDNVFTAGADIKHMSNMNEKEAIEFSKLGQDLTRSIELLPIPVVMMLDGFVLGGGCEISLSADFRIATDRVLIGQPEIDIGVIPGWGGSQRLPRTIGITYARMMTYTGRKFTAEEAYKMGLVDMVVKKEEIEKVTENFVTELASKGRVALAAMKSALHLSWDLPLDKSLELERVLWGLLFSTNDQKEGMNAFLSHRKPVFADKREVIYKADLMKVNEIKEEYYPQQNLVKEFFEREENKRAKLKNPIMDMFFEAYSAGMKYTEFQMKMYKEYFDAMQSMVIPAKKV